MATRKNIKIDDYISEYINAYTRYSPDDLINIANKMKDNHITGVEINSSYESTEIDYFRLETEEEARKREEEEEKRIQDRLVAQQKYIEEQAKMFGYKLVKEE